MNNLCACTGRAQFHGTQGGKDVDSVWMWLRWRGGANSAQGGPGELLRGFPAKVAAELVLKNEGCSPGRLSRGAEALWAEGTTRAEAQRHKTTA